MIPYDCFPDCFPKGVLGYDKRKYQGLIKSDLFSLRENQRLRNLSKSLIISCGPARA